MPNEDLITKIAFNEWDFLPDLDLYMDQLLLYVNRCVPEKMRDQELTKSMVNNYIKQDVIPRPNGKRYGKEHIAELSMLTLLKEILPIQQCALLLKDLREKENPEEIYQSFLSLLNNAFLDYSKQIENLETVDKSTSALYFSVVSYLTRRIALRFIEEQN